MDAEGNSTTPEHREDPAQLVSIGRELLTGRTWGGDVLTFVCFHDGYGIRRNGLPVAGWRWAADQVDDALTAFQSLVHTTRRLIAPPAA